MFYLPGASTTDAGNRTQDTLNDSIQKRKEAGSPNRQSIDGDNLLMDKVGQGSANPDVNEYIVKIEMKKFQNLIENRIKHKNNLTQADMIRVYPLTQKPAAGGMTLYD